MFSDDGDTVVRVVVPTDVAAPDPNIGFVGWIAEGWRGDPVTGYPVWWVKITDSQWGPERTTPPGPPGPAGPAGPPGPTGALADHVPGSEYAVDNGVVVAGTVWRCVEAHTAAAAGDDIRSPFEVDALAGRWVPVGAQPVRTVEPFLAGSTVTVAEAGAVTHLYLRQPGTGPVRRFRLGILAAAGNVAVGVHRAPPVGPPDDAAAADTLAWWSGFVPAVGTTDTQPPQEIEVPGGMVVYAGDLVVVSSDDPAMTMVGLDTGLDPVFAPLSAGETAVLRVDPSTPAPPADGAGRGAATGPRPLVVGVA